MSLLQVTNIIHIIFWGCLHSRVGLEVHPPRTPLGMCRAWSLLLHCKSNPSWRPTFPWGVRVPWLSTFRTTQLPSWIDLALTRWLNYSMRLYLYRRNLNSALLLVSGNKSKLTGFSSSFFSNSWMVIWGEGMSNSAGRTASLPCTKLNGKCPIPCFVVVRADQRTLGRLSTHAPLQSLRIFWFLWELSCWPTRPVSWSAVWTQLETWSIFQTRLLLNCCPLYYRISFPLVLRTWW